MLVREVMTNFVKTVDSSMLLSEAAELMRDNQVGLLPVFESGRLTGMLTDRDIVVRGIAEGKDPERATVREIMTPRVATVFDDQNIEEAIGIMQQNQVRRLAVMNHEQRLVGVLSEVDLADGRSGGSRGADADGADQAPSAAG